MIILRSARPNTLESVRRARAGAHDAHVGRASRVAASAASAVRCVYGVRGVYMRVGLCGVGDAGDAGGDKREGRRACVRRDRIGTSVREKGGSGLSANRCRRSELARVRACVRAGTRRRAVAHGIIQSGDRIRTQA